MLLLILLVQEDPLVLNEIREDLRSECEKFGQVRKVLIFDVGIWDIASNSLTQLFFFLTTFLIYIFFLYFFFFFSVIRMELHLYHLKRQMKVMLVYSP